MGLPSGSDEDMGRIQISGCWVHSGNLQGACSRFLNNPRIVSAKGRETRLKDATLSPYATQVTPLQEGVCCFKDDQDRASAKLIFLHLDG